MPPRKRRQSNQGDEISCDRQAGGSSANNDADKVLNRGQQKAAEGGLTQPERRLTARQQSKQDALENAAGASSATVTSTTDSLKKATGRQVSEPTRFSTRIVKRPRRDLSPSESPAKKAKKSSLPDAITTPETKVKRHWELWSCEDKDSFFEGLCEHGKDFDSIHNLIVSKCKRRGGSQPITVKNKEQVRHFYYRTWHKISKLIEPVEDLKKDIQELYGLISFGVLRKKMRGGINPNDKNWQKLNELVHFGATTVKIKGKKLRIKVPVCPALKKLNNIEEPRREPGPKIPEKIRVEFRPRTNSAWSHVQEQAQNPRLRMTVRPDRCLSSLVRFLEQKWRPHRLKNKENINENHEDNFAVHQEFRVYPHSDSTVQSVNLETVDDPVLHFCLKSHRDAILSSPNVNKKKAKPKSSTPVPDMLSDAKDSVISDPTPSTGPGHFCAIDTHCADDTTSCKLETCRELAYEAETGDDESQTEASDFYTGKESAENDSADVNNTDLDEEKVETGVNQVNEVKETAKTVNDESETGKESADSSKTVTSKEEMQTDQTESSKQDLTEENGCLFADGCVKIKESLSSIEARMNSGCDDNNVKDVNNVAETKDSNSGEENSKEVQESEKSGTRNDTEQSDSCKDPSSESSEVRDSKSWQNTCSDKPSCVKCSSSDSGSASTGPPCDNIKSSESSQSIGQTLFTSYREIAVKESISAANVKESESAADIAKSRTYSTADLSAIVDGENAMFPDAPLDALKEVSELSETGKLVEDGRVERNKTPSVEIDTDGQDSPARPAFSSPTNEDGCTNDSMESSHSEVEKLCRDAMDKGWNVAESEKVKLAELYLMFGKDGELRFEYDWCNTQVGELQEKLLNLNNTLRRLGNIATVEFTDFSKTSNAGTTCHMCGTGLVNLVSRQVKGKALQKSPPGKTKSNKSCKDMSTQTESAVLHKKEKSNLVPTAAVSASPDGIFRVPTASPMINQKSLYNTTLTDMELVQHLNPGMNKQIMRPRKLKSVSRKPVIQRTILPKAQVPGQMVTFYPMVNGPGPPLVGGKPVPGVRQTIVGHPMGIQTQSGNKVTGVNQTIVGHPLGIQTQTVPISLVPTATPSQQLQTTTVHYAGSVGSPTVSSTTISSVELSLSPGDGDETLMRIPESQIGSMSQEALKAAGLTAVPVTVDTSTASEKPLTKGSLSPPNLSSLLDISFSSIQPGGENDKFMDISIADNSFTSLLEENKPLSVDPGLTTPPIRQQSEQQLTPLHSPPVRSLFKMNSPTVDQQWLNGEVPDLSLTSFLESPSKPAYSVTTTQTTSTYNTPQLTLFGDSSRDSQSNRIDVDSTLQCMMNESSIDYVRKFADLAEQIVQGDAAPTHNKPDILNRNNIKST